MSFHFSISRRLRALVKVGKRYKMHGVCCASLACTHPFYNVFRRAWSIQTHTALERNVAACYLPNSCLPISLLFLRINHFTSTALACGMRALSAALCSGNGKKQIKSTETQKVITSFSASTPINLIWMEKKKKIQKSD